MLCLIRAVIQRMNLWVFMEGLENVQFISLFKAMVSTIFPSRDKQSLLNYSWKRRVCCQSDYFTTSFDYIQLIEAIDHFFSGIVQQLRTCVSFSFSFFLFFFFCQNNLAKSNSSLLLDNIVSHIHQTGKKINKDQFHRQKEGKRRKLSSLAFLTISHEPTTYSIAKYIHKKSY